MKIVRRRNRNFIEDENVSSLNKDEIMEIFLAISNQKEHNAGNAFYVRCLKEMISGKGVYSEIKLEASISTFSILEGNLPIVKIMVPDSTKESGWGWNTTIGPNFLDTFSSELKQVIRSRKLKELGL